MEPSLSGGERRGLPAGVLKLKPAIADVDADEQDEEEDAAAAAAAAVLAKSGTDGGEPMTEDRELG